MALSDAIEQLREEESKILERCSEAMKIINASQPELSKIQTALAALGEKPAGKIEQLGAKASKKSGKSAATKVEVVAIVEAVLQEQGVVEKDALKEAVQKKLVEAGRSRQGFGLRFGEALNEAKFVETPAGYRMAEETHVEKSAQQEQAESVG